MTPDRNGFELPASPAESSGPVSLTVPGPEYVGVARLVLAGVAARLGLGFETIDNLQTAIESVILTISGAGREATVTTHDDADRLTVSISPFSPQTLARRLVADGDIDLGALLGRLVDGVALDPEPVSSIHLHIDLPAGRS